MADANFNKLHFDSLSRESQEYLARLFNLTLPPLPPPNPNPNPNPFGVPPNFNAAGLSNTEIKDTWGAVQGAVKFKIQVVVTE